MPQADVDRREMHGGMAQQEQGVELLRRQVDGYARNGDRLAGLRGILLEQPFETRVGGVRLLIDKVVMVLDHDAVDVERRVVLLVHVDRNAPLPGDQLVGLGLTPEKPDVDVPAGTVFRNGIEKAQAVALEQHHRDRMLAVERREAGDGPLLPAVDLFDPFDVDGPLQAQRPGPARPAPRRGRRFHATAPRRSPRTAMRRPYGCAASPARGRTVVRQPASSHHVLRRQRRIGTVLDLEQHRAAFENLQRVPLPFGDVDAVDAFQRVERETLRLAAVLVAENHVEAAAQDDIGFVRVGMAVHGQHRARLQGVEQTLGLGVERVVKVEIHPQAFARLRPGGHFVQKFIVENHTVYGLN